MNHEHDIDSEFASIVAKMTTTDDKDNLSVRSRRVMRRFNFMRWGLLPSIGFAFLIVSAFLPLGYLSVLAFSAAVILIAYPVIRFLIDSQSQVSPVSRNLQTAFQMNADTLHEKNSGSDNGEKKSLWKRILFRDNENGHS